MSNYEQARQLVQVLLKGVDNVTPELIREKVSAVLKLVPPAGVDREELVRDLEARFNVWIGPATILDSFQDHIPWLPARRAEIKWRFWARYERYLEEEKGWAPVTIRRIGELTDRILERLEEPTREGPWDRRGMVVGHVQSGKTANYAGLICKAVDAGYKLIIVLAGIHNSLRSQTQHRLDEDFLGFDTQRSLTFDQHSYRMGAGRLAGEQLLIVNSLTSSADDGDFSRKVANTVNIVPGGDPLILVVKKNASVLRNLFQWALAVRGQSDATSGRTIVKGIPLLVIDDEADLASINTAPTCDENGNPIPDYEATAINREIRRILTSFEQKAYVGYTATPFASVFIHPEDVHDNLGPDLFPSSFIINLPVPTNYIGPTAMFGLASDPDSGTEAKKGLEQLIRVVSDQDEWLPAGHKKEDLPTALPSSLKEAVRSFLLASAARTARGQGIDHKSMLVHVTRFTAVQGAIAELIKEEISTLRRRLEFGDGKSPHQIREELKTLWDKDFVPAFASMPEPVEPAVSWKDVEPLLFKEASKIEVRIVNGTARDVLDYYLHAKTGLSIIAIGGDKLSRGLTLEGLTTSYFLRASKMYDTLMQMGRWFGYRPGYLDVCRLYTSDELVSWYRHISFASEELRQEFDYMVAAGRTPKDFGLRVRNHPAGLLITAANKLRHGTTVSLSYAGDISETVVFHKDREVLDANIRAVSLFIHELGGQKKATRKQGNYIWGGVSAQSVVALLDAFRTHPDSRKMRTGLLASYIKAQISRDELVEWTIALVSKDAEQGDPEERFLLDDCKVRLIVRRPSASAENYSIGRLVSPRDEAIDLDNAQFEEALARTPTASSESNGETSKKKVPSGPAIRETRDKKRGLLLIYPLSPKAAGTELPPIGLALSFPGSKTAKPIQYTVNNVYWKQEFGD
jgi:hypothetical protein